MRFAQSFDFSPHDHPHLTLPPSPHPSTLTPPFHPHPTLTSIPTFTLTSTLTPSSSHPHLQPQLHSKKASARLAPHCPPNESSPLKSSGSGAPLHSRSFAQHESASAATARALRVCMRAPLEWPASSSRRRCVQTCGTSRTGGPNGERRRRPACVQRRVVLAGR